MTSAVRRDIKSWKSSSNLTFASLHPWTLVIKSIITNFEVKINAVVPLDKRYNVCEMYMDYWRPLWFKLKRQFNNFLNPFVVNWAIIWCWFHYNLWPGHMIGLFMLSNKVSPLRWVMLDVRTLFLILSVSSSTRLKWIFLNPAELFCPSRASVFHLCVTWRDEHSPLM